MALSPILAQAILNQKTPDIIGSFQAGQERGRQEKARTLAGEALQGRQGALTELQGVSPEVALQVGESIRARSAGDIEDTIRDFRYTGALLASGDQQKAEMFLTDRLNRLQSQGRDTTQTSDVLNKVRTSPNEAYAGIQKFFNVWDGAKQAVSASATTENLPGGLTKQTLSDGTVRIITASGKILTGQEAEDAVLAAEERGTELQGQRAGARTRETLEERLGREPTLRERITDAESEAEQRQELRKTVYGEARRAQSTLSEVKQLRKAIDAVRTGRLAAARQAVGGLIPGARDADAEALNSAINQFVLRRKDELLGGGILSDADIALLQSVGPQLGNTVEANALILDRFEKYAESAVDRAKRLRDFKGNPLEFEIETFQEDTDADQAVQSDTVNWSDL